MVSKILGTRTYYDAKRVFVDGDKGEVINLAKELLAVSENEENLYKPYCATGTPLCAGGTRPWEHKYQRGFFMSADKGLIWQPKFEDMPNDHILLFKDSLPVFVGIEVVPREGGIEFCPPKVLFGKDLHEIGDGDREFIRKNVWYQLFSAVSE